VANPLLFIALAIGSLMGALGITHEGDQRARGERSCFSTPSLCGYPDATNTGVRPGTGLTASGSRTLSSRGQVLAGVDLAGTVTVAADDVTIRNSRLHLAKGGSGTAVIKLDRGADNFTIRDSEVYGGSGANGAIESAVWNLSNNPGATATRTYFHGCSECWHGAGTIRHSYILVDAGYRGSHDENIYICSARMSVDHSTLVNRHHQTATVFGDTICGGGNRLRVTNSLLAGGGFLIYPQANSSRRVGRAVISGNRFARCVARLVYHPGSGGRTCAGGRDRHGLYPLGGFFGVSADYWTGAPNVWRANVWDDSGRPVCPNGSRGCGRSRR
jgi:hypothetical protein